jgi:hypothetical protein
MTEVETKIVNQVAALEGTLKQVEDVLRRAVNGTASEKDVEDVEAAAKEDFSGLRDELKAVMNGVMTGEFRTSMDFHMRTLQMCIARIYGIILAARAIGPQMSKETKAACDKVEEVFLSTCLL